MVTDVLSPEELATYAERRAIFHALEKAKDAGQGLVMLRQIVAHPIETRPVEVALVFHQVDEFADAPWPASACGTYWGADEVPIYLADCWGPWVG